MTGANGFVGKHLSAALQSKDVTLFQLMHSITEASSSSYKVDLTDKSAVLESFKSLQPEYVVHLASNKNRSNDAQEFRNIYNTNLLMAENVIEACHELTGFKRLVTLGTCDEYGLVPTPFKEMQKESPVNAYGLSKLAITNMLKTLSHTSAFPFITLRPSIIYGPGQSDDMFVSAMIKTLLSNEKFEMTLGKQKRDFVYVDDVVNALISATDADESVDGQVLNIGYGTSVPLDQMAATIASIIGGEAENNVELGALQYRPNEVMDYAVDISNAQAILNWTPRVSLEAGLTQTIKHFNA